jgi:tetratricopeptide (TPR) repeat protein
MNFYTLYRSHNYHFKIYGAMFLGQSEVALRTAAELEASIPEDLLRVPSPPMADWLEAFLGMRFHALIRFGRWHDILALPMPADPGLYCVTTAMLHYARGVFHEAVARVPETRMLFNNTCADILAIASAMLDGELEYRKGNHAAAFAALERSIELDDNLPYDEPWGWMQPTRHAYGALLLEQGRVEEAEAVYRADLGLDGTLPRALQHPNNVWSLHGLHECLTRLGRTGEAQMVAQQLRLAAALADVPVEASCFCRLDAITAGGAEGCSNQTTLPVLTLVAPQLCASWSTRNRPLPPSSLSRACRILGTIGESSPTSQRSTSVQSSRRVIGRDAKRTAFATTSLTISSVVSTRDSSPQWPSVRRVSRRAWPAVCGRGAMYQ